MIMETNKLPKSRILHNKYKMFWKNARRYFREYSESTSIHGIRYIAEKRTKIERLVWFITIILAFAGCSFMILQIYQKWDTSPVMVVFATKETPIFQIPFPAVTICPETKTKKDIFDYTSTIKELRERNLTTNETRHLNYMNMICDMYHRLRNRHMARYNVFRITNDFFDFLLQSVNFSDLFYECRWMGVKKKCSTLFMPVVTDEGLCFSFNMLDRNYIFRDSVVTYKNLFQSGIKSNWSIHNGYISLSNKTKYYDMIRDYPKRALYPGTKNSLVVVLKTSKNDIDYMCKINPKGYKVSLHSPIKFPIVGEGYFKLPLDFDMLSAIKPEVIKTSEAVKKYSPHKRRCFYDYERKLKMFKVYTQSNCQIECLNNITTSDVTTGCSAFYMPRNNGTKICPPIKYFLLMLAEKARKQSDITSQTQSYDAEKDFVRIVHMKRKSDLGKGCNCLPLCTDMSYNVEISQSVWDWKEYYGTVENTTFNEDTSMSKLTLYFKASHFVAQERHELYGPMDFLANFGGLIGLCTGFSLISVIELIYFLTLRIWSNIQLYGVWAGPEN